MGPAEHSLRDQGSKPNLHGSHALVVDPDRYVDVGVKSGLLGIEAKTGKGTETLVDDSSISGSSLARIGASKHRLLYTTPALKAPVHVSGTPRLSIRLALSKPAANLSVWLVSLPWESKAKTTSNLITRGWADPQNYKSLTESEPLTPGKFYDMTFTLQPDDQVIPVGQKIGLMIFSSDQEFTLWPKAGTELTIDLDHTTLVLPVVGGMK